MSEPTDNDEKAATGSIAPASPAPAPTPAPAPAPPSNTTTSSLRKLSRAERREERTAAKRGRRASDQIEPPKEGGLLPLPVPTVTAGTRTENLIAVFLLGLLVGCAGIWIEHDRCPGALKTAALAAAPASIALGVLVASFLAWSEKGAGRALRTRRAILFSVWAAASGLSLATAGLLAWNERGPNVPVAKDCWISRRETIPAPEAGVQDWIVVVSCSDRMSLVRIDVDRARWWAYEPGATVRANLLRGRLGYDWVVDVPALGPPKRNL